MKKQPQKLSIKRGGAAVALLCYLAGALLYLCICLYGLVLNAVLVNGGQLARRQLFLQDFEQKSILQLEDEGANQRFVSTDGDPALIYTRAEGFYAGRFVFRATPNHPGGEMVLYYTTAPGQPFSEGQKLWARQTADGGWYFDLGGKKLYSLRLDTDTTGGVVWQVESIVLGEVRPVLSYFVPGAQPLFLLLLLPGFAAALCLQGAALWRRAVASAARQK
ncbi:MAG: hypothetical protein ACK5L3_11600 [Oscillospiraceae bacterium]